MITKQLLAISLLGTEWVLWILIILSIASWAIILERYFFLSKKKGDIDMLTGKVRDFIKQRDAKKAIQALQDDKTSPAAVSVKMLTHITNNGANEEEYLSVVLSQEKLYLESYIVFLATIVSTAPFIGLFGTVIGIINAFHGLAMNRQGGDIVMAGISEALVATALGLFIAIPAAVAYNYFMRVIKKILISSEDLAHFLILSFSQNN